MNIDMLRLLADHGVPHKTKDDKHITEGWIGIQHCPGCKDDKYHLGWNIAKQYFSCWKCGFKKTIETISELLNAPEHEVLIIVRKYKARPSSTLDDLETGHGRTFIRASALTLPGEPLSGHHVKHNLYLHRRGYEPAKLARTWGLTATSHVGNYKFRVICPIYHEGKVVSFQGRDVTDKSDLRWKTCRQADELREHKHCLGGANLVPGDSVAIVEGFSDAWRLGPGAVCTFGTTYLLEQVKLLRKYRRRFVVLDSSEKDPNAAAQADRLANMLSAFDGETIMVELDGGDPGDMPQAEADYLMEKEWRIR